MDSCVLGKAPRQEGGRVSERLFIHCFLYRGLLAGGSVQFVPSKPPVTPEVGTMTTVLQKAKFKLRSQTQSPQVMKLEFEPGPS